MVLLAGVLDDDPGTRPFQHIFTGQMAAQWDALSDSLPSFAGAPAAGAAAAAAAAADGATARTAEDALAHVRTLAGHVLADANWNTAIGRSRFVTVRARRRRRNR